MKKFNPNEYDNFQTNRKNGSTVNNFFVPVLIVACSCLAMLGVTFSSKLVGNDTGIYNVRIDVINGDVERYEKKVTEGAFRTEITSSHSFGSISCTKGDLKYDPLTNTVSSVYINKDTSCVLVFMDDGVKYINTDELTPVSDNTGISYYYKADAINNYIIVNDKLFRIIRVNGDGTLRVMLNEVVLSSDYANEEYFYSNLKSTLKDWYNTTMFGVNYVVEGDYDSNNYEGGYDTETLINFDSYIYDYVGTLSVREIEIITKGTKSNYLDTANGIWLMNPSGYEFAYYFKDGKTQIGSLLETHNVRPVINIKVESLKGDGTVNNPYTFE